MSTVATDFEFDGLKLSDIGWMIVSFGNNTEDEEDTFGEVSFNTAKAINSKKWNFLGSRYETQYSFSCQIIKMKCSGQTIVGDISTREQAFIHSWLVHSDGYKYIRFIYDGHADVYYNSQIALKWYKIAGEVVGATLTVTCDSPFGYSPIQTFETTVQSGSSFRVYNDSDEFGYIIPSEIEIGILSDGNLEISNNLESIYSSDTYPPMKILRCVKDESIFINGNTKQIYSNNTIHSKTIANDYNYKPIRLINLNSLRENVFTVTGCNCAINIAYRTIRKVVI